MLHKDDDTLKLLDTYQKNKDTKEEKRINGTFSTNRKKSKNFILPLIFLLILAITFIISPSKNETNKLYGEWLQDVQPNQSINAIYFDENIMQFNSSKLKVKYEIHENIIIVKPTIYGIITGIVPAYKFRIIDYNTIEMQAGLNTIFKRIR